ncbi:MAG: NAD+ synthase [Thermoplasmata archaeon]|nr:NAD+ synthase [Thermoplasmata archaeon]
MPLRPKFREEMVSVITTFIRDSLDQSEMKGVIIGMSGGLDSSILARLASDAIGSEKVLGVFLPESTTPEGDATDAESYARELGIEYETVPIDEPLEALVRTAGSSASERTVLANMKARTRMIILYERANSLGRMVLGAGNKSELMVGYFTKFGDGGCDLLPLGDLYKTQIREMAKFLGLPEHLITKPPSAGLWEGQLDEEELGISYDELDSILLGIELGMNDSDISERTGSAESEVSRIRSIVKSTAHKRKMPLIPKIGIKTIGLDWRE